MSVAVATDQIVPSSQFEDACFEEKHASFLQLEAVAQSVRSTQLSLASSMVTERVADGSLLENALVSVAELLQWDCNWTRQFASEFVRVSVALSSLPCLSSAFAEGSLSWSQISLLTRFADSATDAELAEHGGELSLRQLKARVSEADASETKPEPLANTFSWFRKKNRIRFRGDYSDNEAAPVIKALERRADAEGPDPLTGGYRPHSVRQADALVALASQQISEDSNPDLATVQVHVDLNDLPKLGMVGWVEDFAVSMEVIQQLLCDARFQLIPERQGVPVGIGRISRTIPDWLKRLLKKRDNGCRFQSCNTTKGVEGHHIKWWRFLGETNLDNLISLCKRHHRLVHHDGWQILGDPNGPVEFIRPNGNVYLARPPTLDERVRKYIAKMIKRHQTDLRVVEDVADEPEQLAETG